MDQQESPRPVPSTTVSSTSAPSDPRMDPAPVRAPSPAPSAKLAANPLGVLSLLGAIVVVALAALRAGLAYVVPTLIAIYWRGYALWTWGVPITIGLIALLAALLGAVALLLRGRRRAAAIIGVSVSLTWLVIEIGGRVIAPIAMAISRALI